MGPASAHGRSWASAARTRTGERQLVRQVKTRMWGARGAQDSEENETMSLAQREGDSFEYLACHEGGHAAAFLSLGFSLTYVTIIGYEHEPRPHTKPSDGYSATRCQEALIGASGLIAGFWFNGQIMSDAAIVELLIGSRDDRFELVGMIWGQRTRFPRAPFVGQRNDLAPVSPGMGVLPLTADQAIRFWRQCEAFVASVSPAINVIAGEVLKHGRIDGDEAGRLARTAMIGRPAARIPPWAAEE